MVGYLKMDCPNYDFERNSENLIGKVDKDMRVSPQTDNLVCDGGLTRKRYRIEPVDAVSLQESGSRFLAIPSSELGGSPSPDFTRRNSMAQQLPLPSTQTEQRAEATGASGPQESQRGRARLIRLQVAPANSVESSVEQHGSGSLDDAGNPDSPQILAVRDGTGDSDPTPQILPTREEDTANFPELISPSNPDEIPSSQVMQRFLTSDGQFVYGYKDSDGQYHFFYPTLNDRENHNEKERKRRSRVSDACSSLRKLVPGLNEKTDKASVFEHAASYLKFLRKKYGSQFDQVYCDKYYLEKS